MGIEYCQKVSILTSLIMTSKNENIQAIKIKDCAILNIATGMRAKNLIELRDQLLTIHPESIYYHFWAKKLRPGFEEPEYYNDFATWAANNLHDNKLAERLSLINPGMFSNIEEIRSKLVEVANLSLKEDQSANCKESEKFQFTRSDIVVFDTQHIISKPEELTELLTNLSLGSIYFHFIDSKKRSQDISSWLSRFGSKYAELTGQIAKLDPYFFTLSEIRIKASQIFKDYFKGVPM